MKNNKTCGHVRHEGHKDAWDMSVQMTVFEY